MCVGRNTENGKFEFDNLLLWNSKEEVVLGVTAILIFKRILGGSWKRNNKFEYKKILN